MINANRKVKSGLSDNYIFGKNYVFDKKMEDITVVTIIIKMNWPISLGETSFRLVTGGRTFTNSKAVGKFEALCLIGSVSSRECLDAPAILATFTAGRTGLVACP